MSKFENLSIEEIAEICSDMKTNDEDLKEIIKIIDERNPPVKSHIKSLIADNANTSIETLKMLFDEGDPLVMAAVLDNPKTPREWMRHQPPLTKSKKLRSNIHRWT